MKTYTFILLFLITIIASGCGLTREGKALFPSDPARVYYFYTDGYVSCGTSDNPVAHQTYYNGNVEEGKTVMAVGIASNDHVYYWYEDYTVSRGTTTKPTEYSDGYYASNLDENRKLLGVGIAGNDRIYYWYEGGNTAWVSVGTSENPTKYHNYYASDIMKPPKFMEPIAVGIDGFSDHVYYWYPDKTVNSGTSKVAGFYLGYYDSNLSREVAGIAIRNGK
jgi:hypothetical protein